MVETRTYDVFGNLVSKTGSSNCNLGFQGKYFDQESGLYYYYHRYYYPTIGRFINEDPIGFSGGLNLFSFVQDNPLNLINPFGLVKAELTTTERSLTLEEFFEMFGKLAWGKTQEADGSGIYGDCIQLDNGNWYLRFNLTLNLDIYIVTGRPEQYTQKTLAHEYGHVHDLIIGFHKIWDDLFELETDYDNGYANKCECLEKARQVESKMKMRMLVYSLLSVMSRN